MLSKTLFSRKSDEWSTPQDFFDFLDDFYHFTLDPCATADNAKCSKFFTKTENGLLQDWTDEVVFCNPPYSAVCDWIKKSLLEAEHHNSRVVCLVPARVDTRWFHDFVYHNPICKFTFVRGRLKFGNSKTSAPFPSMIIDFKKV